MLAGFVDNLIIRRAPWLLLTRNGNISLLFFALGIGKEDDYLSPVSCPQDSQILTDAFFASALGFGLRNTSSEDNCLIKKRFLEVHAI